MMYTALTWLDAIMIGLFVFNIILSLILKYQVKRIAWLEGRIKGGRDPKRFDKK